MRWRFCLNLGLMWWFLLQFLLRSSDFCTTLGLMWWFWASIRQRFGGCNSVPRLTDPTQPKVVCSQQQVIQPSSWCKRVGCRLGINPTQTDPWTPLIYIYIYIYIYGRERESERERLRWSHGPNCTVARGRQCKSNYFFFGYVHILFWEINDCNLWSLDFRSWEVWIVFCEV